MHVEAILLAAGDSTRFGADKRLAGLPGGLPVLLHAIKPLLSSGCPVRLVIRPEDSELQSLIAGRDGIHRVVCAESRHGMGHSIVCGVAAASPASALLIALADMPYIRSATIRQLRRALETGASIVAPTYRGQRGHPVGFAARWRPQLLALTGDRGARALIAENPDALTLVECDDPGILHDIDHPADLDPQP